MTTREITPGSKSKSTTTEGPPDESAIPKPKDDIKPPIMPKAMVLCGMSGDYTVAQQEAAIGGMIAPGGMFAADLPTKTPAGRGALSRMVEGIRKLIEGGHGVEARGRYEISTGAVSASDGNKKASVEDVSAVIQGLLMNNVVDMSGFKHNFLGYDPNREFDQDNFAGIFSEKILDKVIPRDEIKKELDAIEDPKVREKREEELEKRDIKIRSAIINVENKEAVERYRKVLANGEITDPEKKKTAEKAVEDYDKYSEVIDNVRDTQHKEKFGGKIEGLIHRDKNKTGFLGDDFKEVTVADATALAKWAHESSQPIAKELDNIVLNSMMDSFAQTFHFIDAQDRTVSQTQVVEQLTHDYGLTFDPNTASLMGWISREMALRSHNEYVKVKRRIPGRYNWQIVPMDLSLQDPKAYQDAKGKLTFAKKAHGNTLEEIEARDSDLGSWGKAMCKAAHKGWDDGLISKGDVLGAGSPMWKFALLQHFCGEFFTDIRDHAADRPTFKNETKYQRFVANKFWDRQNNFIPRDEQKNIILDKKGKIINGAVEHRDNVTEDLTIEGVPTMQALILAYTKRTWSKELNVRGYEKVTIGDVWDAEYIENEKREETIRDESKAGIALLAAVNKGRAKKLRYVDEISEADLVKVVNIGKSKEEEISHVNEISEAEWKKTVFGALEFDTKEDLIKCLGKTRLMHDIKRGAYIYLETFSRKLKLESSPDINLRFRNVPEDAAPESTALQQIHYITTQMARDPDDALRVDGRVATSEEAEHMREYAFALRESPELVGKIFGSNRWREIASPDFTDPSLRKKRLHQFQNYLTENDKLKKFAALVGESELDSTALLNTLLDVEHKFVDEYSKTLELAIEQAPEKEHEVPYGGESIGYDKTVIQEALKVSAPPNTPEGLDIELGNIRVAQLLTKYGPRLKTLRRSLDHPYAPRAKDLLGSQAIGERGKLLEELEADMFNSEQFKRIGMGFSTASFKQYTKDQNQGATQFSDRKFATLQFYIFLQQVDAAHKGRGEQLKDTNTYGTAGLTPKGTEVGNLIDFMTAVTEEGDFRITLDELSQQDANERVHSPRSRTPGYTNTTVLRGVSATGAHANEEKGIRILTEDPYTRKLMLNMARNQAASRKFQDLRTQGTPVMLSSLDKILRNHHIDETHGAYKEFDKILRDNNITRTDENYPEFTRETAVDVGSVEKFGQMFANVKDNALHATAEHLGIENPNLVDFGRWIIEYGNGLFEQCNGNMGNAVKHMDNALGQAGRFKYVDGAEDLRVVTLKKRGWIRNKKIETDKTLTTDEARSQASLALDDFTAAWHISRGEDPGLSMVQARGPIRNIRYWYEHRFAKTKKAENKVEDAEAAAGMGLMNSKVSNFGFIGGKDRRRWILGGAVGLGVVGVPAVFAAPLVGLGGLAIAGVATGVVWANERLGVGEYWTKRAQQILGTTRTTETDTEKQYIRAYKSINVGLARAKALINSGNRSWFRFLRDNHATFNLDSAGLSKYDEAVKAVDPLTRKHMLHVSTAKMDETQTPALIEDMYQDTFEARRVKRRALRGGARYYEASHELLENDSIDPANLPEAARLQDIAERNSKINPGIFGTITGFLPRFNPLSKYWGTRMAASNLMDYLPGHRDEVNALGASINVRMQRTFERLSNNETIRRMGNKRVMDSYDRLTSENEEAAVAKLRDGFTQDNSIPTSDAIRTLILRAGEHAHGAQPIGTLLR